MRYRIAHRYTSVRDGHRYGPWSAGAVIDLDPAVAAWINQDSPGACMPDEPTPEPEPEAPAVTGLKPQAELNTEPEANASDDPNAEALEDGGGEGEPKSSAEPKKPGRNRAHTPARTRK